MARPKHRKRNEKLPKFLSMTLVVYVPCALFTFILLGSSYTYFDTPTMQLQTALADPTAAASDNDYNSNAIKESEVPSTTQSSKTVVSNAPRSTIKPPKPATKAKVTVSPPKPAVTSSPPTPPPVEGSLPSVQSSTPLPEPTSTPESHTSTVENQCPPVLTAPDLYGQCLKNLLRGNPIGRVAP